MSPEELFLAHLSFIERLANQLCRRYHFTREETEDFTSEVKVKLIADDYRVLRDFKGKCKFESYLTTVVQHQLQDHANRLWGKWRPSAAAKRLGSIAIRLEKLLRDGHTFEESCEILRTNCRAEESRSELEQIAARLPPHLPRRFEGEERLDALPAPDGSPEQRIRDQEHDEKRARVHACLDRAMAGLPSEDRVIAKLRGERGIVDIARHLGFREEKRLYRRVEKILKTLRTAMEKDGVHGQDIRELLP